jgi:GH15 family glucan-1,4-alpha-glucosidase
VDGRGDRRRRPARLPRGGGAILTEIGDYALLGDCQTAALVHRDGSLDWWPGPRFDGPSAFTRLLDPGAGHFALRAAGTLASERRYLDGTLVLQTEHRTAGGTLRVTDALALEPGARGHEIGLRSPHALVRVAEAVGGDVELEVELVPRLEYGLAVPRLERRDGRVETIGGPERLYLSGGHELELDGGRGSARIALRAGERRGFVLQREPGVFGGPPAPLEAQATLDATIASWRSWSERHDDFDGPDADALGRAALVLQALTYQPSGAVIAAPTTSLPEVVGGTSNWDYRYAWLRDASLIARSLLGATCADEAERYFAWITRAAVSCRHNSHVQIVFGADGERFLEERALDHLRGFADSRPVRVGNAAWRQQQLDALGEVLDVALALDEGPGLEIDPFIADFLCELVDRAERQWRESDAGVWEERDERRHHTISKVMCWAALDRGVRLAGALGEHADAPRWARARDAVRETVLREAWSERRGALAGTLGGDELDAAVLLLPLVGFLGADDERMRRTVAALEDALLDHGLLRRLERLPDEGAFLPATFWLASCHALAGDAEAGRRVFERAAGCANDVGLLPEMVDPASGAALGGLPQSLSHVGLVTAARCLADAERAAQVTS